MKAFKSCRSKRDLILHEWTNRTHAFTARRCASAVLAMALCLSVSVLLLQAGIVSKQLDGSSKILVWMFSSTCPTVSIRKFRYLEKKGVFSSGTFPPNFPQQFNCVVNKTRRRSTLLTTLATVVAPWLDVRCNTPTARIVYYTSVDRNTQTIARSCVCDRCVASYNTCNFR